MTYKVVLIGLGQISMGYDLNSKDSDLILTHAKAYSLHPEFILVGGVDPKFELCEKFKQNYGANSSTDLAKIVSETQPDVVVIASPTEQHYDCMQQVLQHSNPSLILCEKPLSYKLDEARNMISCCKKNNCKLYVNYPRRTEPGVNFVKKLITEKKIEFPIKGTGWYTKGLLHNGSHFTNLLEYWLGPIIEARVNRSAPEMTNRDWEPDIQLVFNSGVVYLQSVTGTAYSHHEIQLLAGNGCLRYEQGGTKITWQEVVQDNQIEGYSVLNSEYQIIETQSNKLLWHVTNEVSNGLSGKPTSLCAGLDGLSTLETLMNLKAN